VFLRWLRAFALTQMIEVPIYRRAFGCGFWEAFGASAITHPLVFWFASSGLWHARWGWRAAACELFAWWVEAAYFRALSRSRVVFWTLVANASSFAFGLICWYYFGLS
jgi:hypothetical protein